MPDIIHLLPDSLANQIAAGEVVQRPASVVKELLENAVDAEATHIRLFIKDAGRTLIRVIDDGKGMSDNDARMCFERHATSKITKREDLFSIRTMGFRGEAMASIAAVSRVELKSRPEGLELGTLVQIEGSEVISSEKIACHQGTSVAVKDLFFNVPARRNFLKSDATEFAHIHNEFVRVALSVPETEFTLYHNDTELYNLKPGNLAKRIVQLFGNNYKEQLVACKESTPYMSVHGYIGKPEYSKRKSEEQFFFVNNRFVKHYFLSKVVADTFGRLLPEGNKPFFVMFIDIAPIHVDVNIHPTKTEIKFDDERTAEAVVRSAVKLALGTHHVVPSLDFSTPVDFASKLDAGGSFTDKTSGYKSSSGFDSRHRGSAYEWEPFFGEKNRPETQNELDHRPEFEWNTVLPEDEKAQTVKFGSAMNSASEGLTQRELAENSASETFHFNDAYIVSPMKSGILVIDRRAAHERILYEQYMHAESGAGMGAQQLLFPLRIQLSPSHKMLAEEIQDEIRKIGFSFEFSGSNTLVLDGVPSDVNGVDEKELLESLIEQYALHKGASKQAQPKQALIGTLAKRLSIKAGVKITSAESTTLIDRLFACQTPNYTPDGAKTYVILDKNQVENLFL